MCHRCVHRFLTLFYWCSCLMSSVTAVPRLSVSQLWRCLYQSEDADTRVATTPGHGQANNQNNNDFS